MRQWILRTDPHELLSACRELEAKSDIYRAFDTFEPRRAGKGTFVLMHPLDNSVPKVLRDLVPERIIVEPSVVWVDVPIPYANKGITFLAYTHTNSVQKIGRELLRELWYLEYRPDNRKFYEWYD